MSSSGAILKQVVSELILEGLMKYTPPSPLSIHICLVLELLICVQPLLSLMYKIFRQMLMDKRLIDRSINQPCCLLAPLSASCVQQY